MSHAQTHDATIAQGELASWARRAEFPSFYSCLGDQIHLYIIHMFCLVRFSRDASVIIWPTSCRSFGCGAQNQFWQTPSTFSFAEATQFFWTDGEETCLTALYVRGDTNPSESITLPREEPDPSSSRSAYQFNVVNASYCRSTSSNVCVQWGNNGTGRFGGS